MGKRKRAGGGEREGMIMLVNGVVGGLEMHFRAFLLQSERRWRSLATRHRYRG